MNAEGRFKYYKVWNKDEWCVSETYIDSEQECHHRILFQYATKEEAINLVEMLNKQYAKEQEYLDKNKRYSYVLDKWKEYKILDNGNVIVEEIPHKSSALLIVDTLNNLYEDKVLVEKWAKALLEELERCKSEQEDEDIYNILKDKIVSYQNRINDLEKENRRLWKVNREHNGGEGNHEG